MHFNSLLKSSLLVAGTLAPWLVAAGEGSDVIDLTQSNFESIVNDSPLVLVEFFAPWCGHCKALAPHYEEASTALKEKGIKLAKVDCVDQADLCAANNIAGYPTMRVYRNGEFSEYGGSREADGIVSYMVKQSLPAVTEVTSENHEEFQSADKVVVVAYLSSTTDAPAPAFSAAANKHREEFLFGLTTDAKAIAAAGVTPPAVVLYKKFDEGRNELNAEQVAELTSESLAKFVKDNSMPLFDEISGDNYASYATTGLPLAYLFVDPADPKREEYIEALKPVAAEHKGVVNFVWIDAIKFVEHAKSLVLLEPTWPSFVIQDTKSQLKYPLDQSTEVTFKTVDHMLKQFVSGRLEPTLKSEPIPEQTEPYHRVVGKTFEDVVFDDDKDVFIQFSASWCGHCKRLLPTWETLSERYSEVKDRLVIAKMDGAENDVPASAGFSISGFPTLKFKPAGSREFIDYEGDRSLESLIEFVQSKAKNDLTPKKSSSAPVDADASAARPAATPVEAHDEL